MIFVVLVEVKSMGGQGCKPSCKHNMSSKSVLMNPIFEVNMGNITQRSGDQGSNMSDLCLWILDILRLNCKDSNLRDTVNLKSQRLAFW